MRPTLFLLCALFWRLSSAASLDPELAAKPHQLVCEALLTLQSKTAYGVSPRIIEGLLKSNLLNKITPAGAARIERELAHLHPASVEDDLLKEELAELEQRIPRLQSKVNSAWRYYWTLSWAGTRVADRDAIKFAEALERRRVIMQRRSELEEVVNKYNSYLRDADARFQSSPGVFLNLTDQGRRITGGVRAFHRAFAHKTFAELQTLILAADEVLLTYLDLRNSGSVDPRAMPAYLAALTLAKTTWEDLSRALEQFLRLPGLRLDQSLSLLLTSVQFHRDSQDVIYDYNALAFDNFIRSTELASPLTALGYKHQQFPERFTELIGQREDLKKLQQLPRQTWPGLIALSLSANRTLSQAVDGALRLLDDLGDRYSRQVPSLLAAVWQSESTFEDAMNLVREFRSEDLAVKSDAAGLTILTLSTGLEKADILAIYQVVRRQNLELNSHTGPLTAIILRRVLEEWRQLHKADIEPTFFDTQSKSFLEMDYTTLTQELFNNL